MLCFASNDLLNFNAHLCYILYIAFEYNSFVLQLTDNLKKQELLDSSTSLIESIQSHITKETQSLPSWCNQKAFQKPAKSSGESAKDTKISIFAKNVSTVDDLKLDCRQLSTPHVISDFMAFKELVNTHMQNMTQGSMDASNTAANIASSSQVDVVTNTTGNMSAVDTVLRRYVACINGESNGQSSRIVVLFRRYLGIELMFSCCLLFRHCCGYVQAHGCSVPP